MAYLGRMRGSCENQRAHTGIGICPTKEGVTEALILTAYGAMYPIDPEEFKDGFPGYISAEDITRMFPIHKIVDVTNSGGDIATQDLGTLGGPRPTGFNALNSGYRIDAGDCLYKELSQFDQQTMRVFRYDGKNLYGTIVQRGDQYYFAGFSVTVMTQRTPADGSNLYNLSLFLYYSNDRKKEEQNMNSVPIEQIPEGLVGITLEAAGTLQARVVETCSGDDVTSIYGSQWDADMFETAAGVNPTTVTYSEETKLLTFAPTGAYRIVGAAALEAAGISGLEGDDQYVQI